MTRLRATFLLRSLVVLAELVAVLGGMVICWFAGQPVLAIALLLVWVLWEAVGEFLDLFRLPGGSPSRGLVDRIVRRAERRGLRGPSPWFVDLDVEQHVRDVSYGEDTRDNPTLR